MCFLRRRAGRHDRRANIKANSELIGRGLEYGRAVLWRHHRHRRIARSAANVRAGATLSHLGGNSRYLVILALLVLAPPLTAAAFRDGGATFTIVAE